MQEASCFFKWNATAEQRRMLYLITRGPRYTPDQTRYTQTGAHPQRHKQEPKRTHTQAGKHTKIYIKNIVDRSLASLLGAMRRQYSNATLTRGSVTFRGEGDVTHLMRTCRDPDVLVWAWGAWHDTLGPQIRPLFTRAVDVMNSAARRGGGCLEQGGLPPSQPGKRPCGRCVSQSSF